MALSKPQDHFSATRPELHGAPRKQLFHGAHGLPS
uniref:Uncharacterized protein n=1 Tax=Anguilla anguilla TaxID=7936 RepID=A0A0E9VWM6_ANGAN